MDALEHLNTWTGSQRVRTLAGKKGMKRLVLGGLCAAGHRLTPEVLVEVGSRKRCRNCQLEYQRKHYWSRRPAPPAVAESLRQNGWMREGIQV